MNTYSDKHQNTSDETLTVLKKTGFFDLSIPIDSSNSFQLIKQLEDKLSEASQENEEINEEYNSINDFKEGLSDLKISFFHSHIYGHFKEKINNIFKFLPESEYPKISDMSIKKWKEYLYNNNGEYNKPFYDMFFILQNTENIKDMYEVIKKDIKGNTRFFNWQASNIESKLTFYSESLWHNSSLNNTMISDLRKIKNIEMYCQLIKNDKDLSDTYKDSHLTDVFNKVFSSCGIEQLHLPFMEVFSQYINMNDNINWRAFYNNFKEFKKSNTESNTLLYFEKYMNFFLKNNILEKELFDFSKNKAELIDSVSEKLYSTKPVSFQESMTMCEIISPKIVTFILSKHEAYILKETIYSNEGCSVKKRL